MKETAPSTAVDRLLHTPGPELDALFRRSPSGRIPVGDGAGTVIFAPNSPVATTAARLVRLLAWQGKVFGPGTGSLRNKMGPLGTEAVPARVYYGTSRLDAGPAIILDYSRSALVARRIRDEIREVAPGVFLGIAYWNRHKVLRFVLEFARAK
ncbi:hypothetical protein ACFQ36_02720 [Arthrobacter sp. GCM10027362]|uniref:hypothetical protein n=1 Tax=Arthrobacter sp. GCM10027362 TaxID=3273379 RepID=UPI00362BD9C7